MCFCPLLHSCVGVASWESKPPLLCILQSLDIPTGSDVPELFWSLSRRCLQILITLPHPKSWVHDMQLFIFPYSQEPRRGSTYLCLVTHCAIFRQGFFFSSLVAPVWVLKTCAQCHSQGIPNSLYFLDLLSRVYMKTCK